MATNTYVRYDPNDVTSPTGLHNSGSICWFNSLVQLMLSVSSVMRRLRESPNKNILAQRMLMVSDSLSLLEAFVYCAKSKGYSVDYLLSGQQCADEGLTLFLDSLNDKFVDSYCAVSYECSIVCPACNKATIKRDNMTQIDWFSGNSQQRQEINSQQDFCNWIRDRSTEVDTFTCEECKTKSQRIIRTEKLKYLGEVVFIMFAPKLEQKTNIWFPNQLRFRSHNGDLVYSLIGKIEHSGSRFGGHYWANVLRQNTWYQCNDSSISAGSPLPTAETFIIAYHMM